jgi:hypothetical protein
MASGKLNVRDLLIDPDGETFTPTPLALQDRLGVGSSDIDLVAYAVRNLGYIELRQRDGRLAVLARPELVSPVTLAALEAAIVSAGRAVALMTAGSAAGAEIFPSPRLLMRKLEQLCRDRSLHADWSSYVATPLRIEDLTGPEYGAIHLLTAEWKLLGRRMDQDMLGQFLRRKSSANTAVARRSADRQSIVFVHGRFVERPWTSEWMRNAAGLDLRNHADRRYGAWAAKAYQDVLTNGRPRLERVKARLRCPDRGPREFDYDRLILPWRQADGERLATLVSVVRDVKIG